MEEALHYMPAWWFIHGGTHVSEAAIDDLS